MNALFLPGLEKELMKRCSVYELLTSGNLGPLYCRRSLGVLHRQNQTADGDFMAWPQMGFCHCATWTQSLFSTPSRVSHLHLNQVFRSSAIWRVTQINKGPARGTVPLNKISHSQLRAGCQRGASRGQDWSKPNNTVFKATCPNYYLAKKYVQQYETVGSQ